MEDNSELLNIKDLLKSVPSNRAQVQITIDEYESRIEIIEQQ